MCIRDRSTTDWLGNEVQYLNYNALGEVQNIAYPSSTGESLNYNYDADGNVEGLAYSGTKITGLGGSDSWSPNADNQVGASTSLDSYASSSDTYNLFGRVHTATNPTPTGSEPGADTYLYDHNGTLADDEPPAGAPGGSSTITYNYNNGQELTSITNPNNPASTEYGSLGYTGDGQRCWSNWASSVTSQACGSAPSSATQYGWNVYGQLCFSGSTTGAASCSSSGGTSYTYDGNNLRMTSTTSSSTTSYDWDTVTGGTIPLDISDGNNSYIYGPLLFGGTAPIEQISTSGAVSFLASTQTGVQAVFTSGSNPALCVGPGPTLCELAAYSLWGTQVIQQGSKATPFGFQGSYTDSSGLIYLIDRYYDPSTAQFLSIDPDVAETGQPYEFTGDDPLNSSDPLGLISAGTICGTHGSRSRACRGAKQVERKVAAFDRRMASGASHARIINILSDIGHHIATDYDSGNESVGDKIPGLGPVNRWATQHPVQAVAAGGAAVTCAVTGVVPCVAAGVIAGASNVAVDEYQGCSASQTSVDAITQLLGAGLSGVSKLGEQALEGSALKYVYGAHQSAVSAAGSAASACG